MAIDTAERRRAAAHVARKWAGAGVTPNAGKDQEWRQQAGRSYSGILADDAAPPAPAGNFHKYALKSIGRMMGHG